MLLSFLFFGKPTNHSIQTGSSFQRDRSIESIVEQDTLTFLADVGNWNKYIFVMKMHPSIHPSAERHSRFTCSSKDVRLYFVECPVIVVAEDARQTGFADRSELGWKIETTRNIKWNWFNWIVRTVYQQWKILAGRRVRRRNDPSVWVLKSSRPSNSWVWGRPMRWASAILLVRLCTNQYRRPIHSFAAATANSIDKFNNNKI